MSQVTFCSNEKPVLVNPVPKDYAPSHVWYKVTDLDDWATVAQKYGVTVHDLILFNFKTLNTGEINWYLHRNVGCKVSRDGGLNWAFSRDALPGKIYIPAKQISFEPEPVSPQERGGQNKLARWLDDAKEKSEKASPEEGITGWEVVHLTLDVLEIAHATVEIFEGAFGAEAVAEGAGAVVGESVAAGIASVAAPLAGLAAVFISLGAPYLETLKLYQRKAWFWGFGIGAVLGANKNVTPAWMKYHFDTNLPASIHYLIGIPTEEDQFVYVKKAFLEGMINGFKYGRQLTTQEAATLYRILKEDVDTYAPEGSAKYYFNYGAAFRTKFLPSA